MKKIDISKLKHLLDEATQKMRSTHNNIEINTIMENLITSVMHAEFASLWVFDMQNALLLRERSYDHVREISMLEQRGVLAKCFFTLSSGIYNYLASEKEYLPDTDNPDGIQMKSKVIVPLLDGERLIGMVTAYSSVKKIRNFDTDDVELLEIMVPFMINVLYRMHPHIQKDNTERVYVGKRLLDESYDLIEKVEEIQKIQQPKDTTNETLGFLSKTVHDIRTPANTLHGFLELLEEQLDDSRLLQYIHNAKESAQFINDLTTSILDRVSHQREQLPAKQVQLNPTKFFANIAETFSANMFNKKITFNIYIDPSLPKKIMIEDIILKRVLTNLISNAYKFTPSKKTIDFTVIYKPSTEMISISVKDSGIGIAKEKQDEIFKEFTQAEEDTYDTYGGTGLGLSISAQYVKDLGGELKIESQLDLGSNFYFDLPVNVVNKTAAIQTVKHKNTYIGILLDSQSMVNIKNLKRYLLNMGIDSDHIIPVRDISKLPENTTHLICFQSQYHNKINTFVEDKNLELLIVEEQFLSLIQDRTKSKLNIISPYGYYANTLHTFISNRSQLKVLVVDDDIVNLKLIKAMLEDEFCQIDTTTDAEDALKMLKRGIKDSEPYSLVYLDHHMPKLTGLEVISQFRAFERKKHAHPVYAINISGDPSKEKENFALFDAYISKPFNKQMIKDVLEEAIEKNKL